MYTEGLSTSHTFALSSFPYFIYYFLYSLFLLLYIVCSVKFEAAFFLCLSSCLNYFKVLL